MKYGERLISLKQPRETGFAKAVAIIKKRCRNDSCAFQQVCKPLNAAQQSEQQQIK
jgi:hypothetical protein